MTKLSLSRALRGELDTELNRAMAEAVGWTFGMELCGLMGCGVEHPTWRNKDGFIEWPPNFLHGLSALGHVAAAEEGLSEDEWPRYVTLLQQLNTSGNLFKDVSAPPLHRVIAYLRVKSPELWRTEMGGGKMED